MKKDEVLAIVTNMPEEVDVDKLIYTLRLKHKRERAEADVAGGRVVSQEEVEREMGEWRD